MMAGKNNLCFQYIIQFFSAKTPLVVIGSSLFVIYTMCVSTNLLLEFSNLTWSYYTFVILIRENDKRHEKMYSLHQVIIPLFYHIGFSVLMKLEKSFSSLFQKMWLNCMFGPSVNKYKGICWKSMGLEHRTKSIYQLLTSLVSHKNLFKILISWTDTGLRTYSRRFMWRSGSRSLKKTLYGLCLQLWVM